MESSQTQFDWRPFYEELARKLLEYKQKREKLVEFIFAEDGLNEFSNYLHLQDKSQKISDIDPFSFMGMFNRGSLSIVKRKEILRRIKNRFNISADVPSNFDGIPVLNRARMFFYNWNDLSKSCDDLWSVYESMINGDLKPWFGYYKIANRNAECTMPLFWCKPSEYIALDSRNRDYLKEYGISINVTDVDSYKKLIEEIHEKMASGKIHEKDFTEISFNAWKGNKPTSENLINEKDMSKKESEYSGLLRTTHNLILTGAPGTGKTYLAKQIAQQMIFGEIKEKMTDEEKKQFDVQCEFVQFHPSFDYADFVEGLRPIKSVKDDNKNIGFERKDGVFKAFCKNALIKQTANASVTDKLNDNPTVWKVSLVKTGDNPIRKYCMDNGYIRIGWDEYGDVEDFSDYNGFTKGGKNVLNAFQNQMKQGDIVASCWSENEVDAIGIVTGDYEYINTFSNLKRVRKVDWLVKGIKENIVAINNNKKFTLSTVYKSNITVEDALKIVTKHSTQTINNVNRHFVFIIDEINRGEISKIFGELFFSIDPGYRGEKGRVQTQYQNIVEDGDIFKKGFFVPENVYIIGTMNDIDRSVESMDFAFRRRFAFKEIKAMDRVEMLYDSENGIGNYADEAKKRMNRLNKEIEKIEGLSTAYHIGPAYFLKLKNYNGDFQQLWDNHLEGLLREYLRGMQNLEEKLKTLKAAYDNESDSDNGQQQE